MEPIALVHETNVRNLARIFKWGMVFTPPDAQKKGIGLRGGFTGGDWATGGQYPGLYMGGITRSDIGTPLRYWSTYGQSQSVILVFCTALLNRGDFHYNRTDSNGYLSSLSTGPSQLQRFIANRIVPDEFVFHNSVPVIFLRAIWLPNEKVMRYIPPKYRSIANVRTTVPNKEYPCISTKVRKLTPNYCYSFDKYARPAAGKPKGFTEPMSMYRKIAFNCGMPVSEIKKFPDAKSLDKALLKYVNRRFMLPNDELQTNYYEPPF